MEFLTKLKTYLFYKKSKIQTKISSQFDGDMSKFQQIVQDHFKNISFEFVTLLPLNKCQVLFLLLLLLLKSIFVDVSVALQHQIAILYKEEYANLCHQLYTNETQN